jgi:membrane associated rhomboid family serine protease
MRPASVGFQCPDDVKLGRVATRAPLTAVGARIRTRPPYVTGVIIALNVAVYLITAIPSERGINNPSGSALFRDWWLVPQQVAIDNQYYRLITSAFLHYDLLHIIVNMIALAMVGPYLERLLGPIRFAAVYLLGAFGGSVAVYLFGDRFTTVAGASGAIFGLFAGALLLVRELGLDPRALIGTIVLNFVLTFSVPNISTWGHIGGFVVGGLAAIAIAGLPRNRKRVAMKLQAAGLVGLLAVLVILVVWRTAVL